MKKVFLVLFASAAFSIVGCKSGQKNDKMEDSMEMKNDVNQAMQSVDSMHNTPADTMHTMTDTTKKM